MRLPHRPSRSRRLPRAALAGLACLLAASSLSLAPVATASEESKGGGEAPFGEQIEPGTNIQDTTPVETGTYALPIPEVAEDHFFEVERTEPGEVIWYGATVVLPEAPTEGGNLAVVGLADGDESQTCDDAIAISDPITIQSTLYNANRQGVCREAESIVLQVQNREGLGGPALPTDGYYQLTIWTEPAVGNRDQLPGANENSPWVAPDEGSLGEPQQVEGATTFTDATELETGGVYDVTVRQGQPAIFAFPLTYGQHAQVEAEVLEGVDTFESLEPIWVTPLGGRVRTVVPAGGPRPDLNIDGEDGTAGWSTPIIGYLNRERIGTIGSTEGTSRGGFAASPAAFAGTYFLVLELETDTEFSDFPEELPVRLTSQVVTDYEGVVPDYVAEPTALSALDGSGFVETAEQEQAARAAEAEPAPWGLAAGLFAGAALLAVVGGVAIGRVLRRPA